MLEAFFARKRSWGFRVREGSECGVQASQEDWKRELPMPPRVEPPPQDDRDERLSVRQAILVWLAAAAVGWLITVGAVYLASHVF